MKTKTIKHRVFFKASPENIYEMLMDSKKHSKFTGAKANISRKVGGKFSAFNGWIVGTNKELIKNQKIVQLWCGDDWPEEHFSEVKFILNKSKYGTKLEFTHKKVPVQFYNDISKGWKEYYWKPMKNILEK